MTQPTKQCAKCGAERSLADYQGRRNTCTPCLSAAAAKRQAKKEAIAYSPELGERIVDGVASGLTFAEICAPAGMPTVRQLTTWRRRHPELADAMDAARVHRASIRSDRIDETLAELRAQKISAADARTLIDGEMKLMALEDPGRYSPTQQVRATVAGMGENGAIQIEAGAGDGLRALSRAIVEVLRDAAFEAAVVAKAVEARALPAPPAAEPAAPELEDVVLEFDPYDSSLNVVPLFGRREG